MRHSHKNQVVSLERFTEVARRSVNMRVAGVIFLSYGVLAPFWGNDLIPFWVSVTIASFWGGLVWYNGANYIEAQVAVWIDKMMEIEVSDEAKDLDQEIIIKEPSEMGLEIIGGQGEVLWTVPISIDQLINICQVYESGERLVRSDLDPNYWPSLTRRWQSGDIQRKLRKMGLIGFDGRFRSVGWSGDLRDQPEVDRTSDTGSGVGG